MVCISHFFHVRGSKGSIELASKVDSKRTKCESASSDELRVHHVDGFEYSEMIEGCSCFECCKVMQSQR